MKLSNTNSFQLSNSQKICQVFFAKNFFLLVNFPFNFREKRLPHFLIQLSVSTSLALLDGAGSYTQPLQPEPYILILRVGFQENSQT